MLMVLPNGGKGTFYKDSHDGRFPCERLIIHELIPHIGKTHHTCRPCSPAAGRGFLPA